MLQLPAQIEEIVDLTVEDQRGLAMRVKKRLVGNRPGVQNAEATVGQGAFIPVKVSGGVRSPVAHAFRHRDQPLRFNRPAEDAQDTAHG
jgi:hypothetical protein